MGLAGADHFVVREPIGPLIGVREKQRVLVPGIDQRRFLFRQRDRAAVARLDRRVAAHVIAVAVRIDQPRERRRAQSLRRREQLERQRRVPHVTRVDQHVTLATLEQDVVRRQPVAHEDADLGRKRWGGAGHLRG